MANKIAIVIASADFNTSRGLVFMPPNAQQHQLNGLS